mmetsp:Transcript_3579/g.8138  ORF Transcript_3579/g.8138 Transcript_3579/m.8138 type:complete len:119 (-) Transcript_3579:505-861(-)
MLVPAGSIAQQTTESTGTDGPVPADSEEGKRVMSQFRRRFREKYPQWLCERVSVKMLTLSSVEVTFDGDGGAQRSAVVERGGSGWQWKQGVDDLMRYARKVSTECDAARSLIGSVLKR